MYTKSTDWFEDSKGWKSTQGGFSAIQQATTDENNMGGFFVRKLAGGAGCAVQLHKILPVIWQEPGAQWTAGHFQPWLITATVGNLVIAAFLATYMEDLTSAGAQHIPIATLAVLAIETLVMLRFLFSNRKNASMKRLPAIAMPEGKTPSSLVSNIATRTMFIVTSLITVIAARDLFLPGTIVGLIPRDDIYLEWTNAFLHSPPHGSPEASDQSLEAPLYIGDKFVSQLAATYILILCLYKYVTAIAIRFGADGSGTQKARMIWKSAFLGDVAILMCFRFFAHAARTASFDTRWHLCFLSYETFMIGTNNGSTVYNCSLLRSVCNSFFSSNIFLHQGYMRSSKESFTNYCTTIRAIAWL